jgi:REP element-mobilizing transposase RayT
LIEQQWLRTAQVRTYVEMDEFVIMPNHFHGILWLFRAETAEYGTGTFGKPQAGSLSTIVGLFKSEVTKAAKARLGIDRVWQRGFHEHVVRSEKSLGQIRQYIADNPAAWADDEENPQNRIGP